MTNTKDKALKNFVTNSSRRLFYILGVPDNVFYMDPETWKESEDSTIVYDVICSLAITNYYAEWL